MKIIAGITLTAVCTAIVCAAADSIRNTKSGQELISFGKKKIAKIKSKIQPAQKPAAESI